MYYMQLYPHTMHICHTLPQLQSGDSQLLLVAIAQHVSAGHSGRVASLLLLPQHKVWSIAVNRIFFSCDPLSR